jgi:hypothetical protein
MSANNSSEYESLETLVVSIFNQVAEINAKLDRVLERMPATGSFGSNDPGK